MKDIDKFKEIKKFVDAQLEWVNRKLGIDARFYEGFYTAFDMVREKIRELNESK